MNISPAYISHRSSSRLRIRVPSRKKDASYFAAVKKAIQKDAGVKTLKTDPTTGSVLILDRDVDVENIREIGKSRGLFLLAASRTRKSGSLSRPVVGSLTQINEKIEAFSGGSYDLWELLFVGLLGLGVYEVLRGNVKSPPWYTIFWYAFGIYTKSIIDKAARGNDPSSG